jgi:hypothetical protein
VVGACVFNEINHIDFFSSLLTEIASSWDGCQKYFYRSLAWHTRLNAALATPAKVECHSMTIAQPRENSCSILPRTPFSDLAKRT